MHDAVVGVTGGWPFYAAVTARSLSRRDEDAIRARPAKECFERPLGGGEQASDLLSDLSTTSPRGLES
jgi:hypothetical protein